MSESSQQNVLPTKVQASLDPRVPLGSDPSFIGKGFAWPFGVDHTGAIALGDPVEELDRAIEIVLMTAPGERLMRPEFGCHIWDLLFEPVTPTLIGQISTVVRRALAQWEPRIEVESVTPVPSQENNGLVHIEITYLVRATNSRRNLVYPFYLIPHDAEE